VCVVGSGPAGTILARKLAASGLRVIVVEAGPVLRKQDFRKEAGHTLSRFFWEGGLRTTMGNVIMPTMQARCLGGGSVFNSAICMRTPRYMLERWAHEHGLEGHSEEDLRPHFEAVEAFMGVRPVDPSVQGRRNELFRQGAEAMGFGVAPIERNEEGCRGSGECLTGCPTGAKKSMDLRGVPELVEAGGRVYTSVTVEKLILEGSRVRGVLGVMIEPYTGRRTETVRIDARCTVLAAGALATPVIIQKSGIKRDAVGSNLCFHPGSVVMGVFDDEVAPWGGATQGYHCVDFLQEGIKLESLWAIQSLLAFRFPGLGTQFKDMLSKYKSMASWDVWVSGEDSVGRIRAMPAGRPQIFYNVGMGDVRRMQEGTAKLIEMFFAAGARSVLPGIHGLPASFDSVEAAQTIRRASISPQDLPTGSNHVFGTAAMGGDRKRHATDSWGALYDVDDLYCCDTSLFPSSPGVNPMLTAMALADRLGDTIARRY
jgi:choline dehydrogenase-like flavoprotein